MFERYTERARRVVFFSRYEASQFGSTSIEASHLLLGLIREDKNLTNRFLRDSSSIENIRREIESTIEVRGKISTSIDLPLSAECKRILAYANEEAERLNHRHIGTEHVLLGILREESCVASRILLERGLRLDAIREELARSVPDRQELSIDMPDPIAVRPDPIGHRLQLNSRMLADTLDKHGLSVSKAHFSEVMSAQASGDLKTAQAELRFFLDSLVDTIHDRNPKSEVLSPIFDGFDWRTSVQGLRSGLPDEEDWKFRLWLTLLLAELLLDRYERG